MDDRVRFELDSVALVAILRHPGHDDFLAKIGMRLSEMGVKDGQISSSPWPPECDSRLG